MTISSLRPALHINCCDSSVTSSLSIIVTYFSIEWKNVFQFCHFLSPHTDDIVRRYQALQAQLEERLQTLRNALADSQDIRANLDMMLKWLDQAEKETHKLDKGTLVRVQKEPLRDVSELQQVRQKLFHLYFM